ncbi:MAG: acyl-CoA thioesterase [Ignavibacteriae bacterium]|nr:acyl-CoA thioesterase [Ignavibacteriota bacterium]
MFTTKYKISFGETDPGGIIFFAELFKITHIVYERLFENFGTKRNYFLDDEFMIPIVHTEADFVSPMKFGDEIKCTVMVEDIGSTSFLLKYQFQKNDKIMATSKTTHVMVNKNNFVKTKIPIELMEKLKEH